jgi:hypothetical protein
MQQDSLDQLMLHRNKKLIRWSLFCPQDDRVRKNCDPFLNQKLIRSSLSCRQHDWVRISWGFCRRRIRILRCNPDCSRETWHWPTTCTTCGEWDSGGTWYRSGCGRTTPCITSSVHYTVGSTETVRSSHRALPCLPIQRIGHVPRLIVSYVGLKQRHFWRNGDKDTEGITKRNGRKRKRNKHILQKSFPVEVQRLCLR